MSLFTALLGRTNTSPIPIDVAVFLGHSNETGLSDDQASYSYAADPNVIAWGQQHSAWQQYSPTVFTGTRFTLDDGQIGPEMAFAQAYRVANPTKKLAIIKDASPGTYYSIPAGQGLTFANSWSVANGQRYGTFKTSLFAAIASLISQGYTPTIRFFHINLGGNDANFADSTAAMPAEAAALYAAIRADLPVTAGVTTYLFPTCETDRSFYTTILASQKTLCQAGDFWLIDASTYAHNPSGGANGATHYALAGLNQMGTDAYNTAVDPLVVAVTAIKDKILAYWDPKFWAMASGSVVPATSGNVATLRDLKGTNDVTQATDANRPTLSTTINGRPSMAYDGVNDSLSKASATGLPSGGTAAEYFAIVNQTAPSASDFGGRQALCFVGAAGNTQRLLGRVRVSSVNRGQFTAGTGAATLTDNDIHVVFTNVHVINARYEPGVPQLVVGVDGNTEVNGAGTVNSSDTRMFIGNSHLGGFWLGDLGAMMVTSALTSLERTALLTALRSVAGV